MNFTNLSQVIYKLHFILSVIFILCVVGNSSGQTCNCPQNSYFVGSSKTSVTNISSTSIPIELISGQSICLQGTLNIDRTLQKFKPNSHIYFGQSAKIVVKSGKTLDSESAYYDACEEIMYRGIDLESGSILNFSGNIVNDAFYGVNAQSGATIKLIAENVFNRNYVGIRIPNGGVNISTIIQNQFLCEDFLIPTDGEPGNNRVSDGVSWCGIQVYYNTTIDVRYCTFSNQINGITALYSSTVSVDNCTFENMLALLGNVDINFVKVQGFAIYCGLNSVATKITNCSIDEALVGIRSNNSNLRNVSNNTLLNVDVGIYEDGQTGNSLFDNDSIHFRRYGIWIKNPLLGFSPTIKNSGFSSSTVAWLSERYGIYFEGVKYSSTLENNYFTLDRNCNGILLKNSPASQVTRNQIYFDSELEPIESHTWLQAGGIVLQNANNCYLIANQIEGVNYDDFSSAWGIKSTLSQNVTYCCNGVKNSRTAYSYTNNCDRSKWLYNRSWGTYFNGLLLNSGAVYGPQPDPRKFPNKSASNIWAGSISTETGSNKAHARNANSNLQIRRMSEVWAGGCSAPSWPPSILPSQSCTTGLWINTIANPPSTTCLSDPQCVIPSSDYRNIPDNYLTQTDEDISRGELGNYVFGDVAQWEGMKFLYDKLNYYPELIDTINSIDSFYNESVINNLDKYYSIYSCILNTFKIDTVRIKLLDSLNESVDLLINDGNDQSEEYLNDTISAHRDSIWGLINNLNIDILDNREIYNALIDTIQEARDTMAELILEYLSAITPNGLIENNESITLELYARVVLAGIDTLTETQYDDLFDVASQCVQEGGAIVYLARSIISNFDSLYFDDDILCDVEEMVLSNNNHVASRNKVSLTPNPSNNSINLAINENLNELFKIEITSLDQGYRKNIEFINDGLNEIDIHELASGLYLVRIYHNGVPSNSLKLVKTDNID
ncbi:MAG: T9SS type A sorting domain-containing protein [Saprospiraceae bacterium]